MKIEAKKLKININKRANFIVGNYDLTIRIGENSHFLVGSGSINVLGRLVAVSTNVAKGCILECGRYCDFNRRSAIVLGGEHTARTPTNFSGVPYLRYDLSKRVALNFDTKGKVKIGHQSILSVNSSILSGSQIGNRSLVAAGAVVAGKFSDKSLLAGVPAKAVKELDWGSGGLFHKHSPEFISKHYESLLVGDLEEDTNIFEYRVVLDAEFSDDELVALKYAGIASAENPCELIKVPNYIDRYFLQINEPNNQETCEIIYSWNIFSGFI